MYEPGFMDYFSTIEDPRCDMNKRHSVEEILLLTLCAVICGAEGWNDVEVFGQLKLMFLRQLNPLPSAKATVSAGGNRCRISRLPAGR